MNNLKVFENPDLGKVRVVERSGEPWFVAADVCRALGLDSTGKALTRLDDDEKGVNSIHTLGGSQMMTIINESGLYALVLGSRKPEAKAFKRWVTHEVLPAIRQERKARFGRWFDAECMRRYATALETAEALGTSDANIYRWRSGQCYPQPRLLQVIINNFGPMPEVTEE